MNSVIFLVLFEKDIVAKSILLKGVDDEECAHDQTPMFLLTCRKPSTIYSIIY